MAKQIVVTTDDWDWIREAQLVDEDIADNLWVALVQRDAERPGLSAANVAYYAGAALIVGGMGWFIYQSWYTLIGGGLFLISLGYFLLALFFGTTLARQPEMRIPGSVLTSLAIFCVPLMALDLDYLAVTYGLLPAWVGTTENAIFFMTISTMIVAGIALWVFRFPSLLFPLLVSMWFLTLEIIQVIDHTPNLWADAIEVSIVFGLVVLAISFWFDQKTEEDFSGWGYFLGLLSFWGGCSFIDGLDKWDNVFYCAINIALIMISVVLQRKIFLICGALGLTVFLTYVSYVNYSGSNIFPICLAALGAGLIIGGVKYQRKHEQIERYLLNSIPKSLRKKFPALER